MARDESLIRRDGEDEYAYIYRICSTKDAIGTWGDVAAILNEQLGYEYTESKYRKQYQSFQRMFEANRQRLQDSEEYAGDINEQLRELRKERIKLQTEKLEYNKWLREMARDEMILEKIADEVRKLPQIAHERRLVDLDGVYTPRRRGGIVGILCFGDEHYGAEFTVRGLRGEILNHYSPDVFEQRMTDLLEETIDKALAAGLSSIKVYSFGDELDGILRVSQLSKLKYGVVESAIRYADFMSRWLSTLSEFVEVEYHMAEGNHTELRQIGQPKGTFVDDNMSRVIKEIIKVRLEDNPKFTLVDNESGHIYDRVCDFTVVGIHGEVKNMESALKTFSTMYDTPIDILIGGHKHHHAAEAVGIGKDVISVPSIIGVDPYSMSIGKTADAGAAFLIIEPVKGVIEQHIIKFFE